MPPALTHLALHVKDIEAAMSFYRDYCEMLVVHDRGDHASGQRVVWLSEAGREHEMTFVLISGGPGRSRPSADFGHLGFALASREAVDAIAERGRSAGILAWPARQEPYPVGYYCGLSDPDGQIVEFSYGQPLGPGTTG